MPQKHNGNIPEAENKQRKIELQQNCNEIFQTSQLTKQYLNN